MLNVLKGEILKFFYGLKVRLIPVVKQSDTNKSKYRINRCQITHKNNLARLKF